MHLSVAVGAECHRIFDRVAAPAGQPIDVVDLQIRLALPGIEGGLLIAKLTLALRASLGQLGHVNIAFVGGRGHLAVDRLPPGVHSAREEVFVREAPGNALLLFLLSADQIGRHFVPGIGSDDSKGEDPHVSDGVFPVGLGLLVRLTGQNHLPPIKVFSTLIHFEQVGRHTVASRFDKGFVRCDPYLLVAFEPDTGVVDRVVGHPAVLIDRFGVVGYDHETVGIARTPHPALGTAHENGGEFAVADGIASLQAMPKAQCPPPGQINQLSMNFL